MKPVLIFLNPYDKKTGARRAVYVASSPSAEHYGAGGTSWQPALVQRPQLTIDLFTPDMDGAIQTGKASFTIALNALRDMPDAADLYWRGALVVIYASAPIEGPTARPEFVGYITQAAPDTNTGRLSITAEVSDVLLARPLLTRTFGGGGGLDGDAGKRGVFMPAGFGKVDSIEPDWFDLTRNIGMIDGYGNTIAIDWLGEGGSSFGPRVADYPNYAALAAAIDAKAVQPGQWASCVAEGLVGLGAPPVKPITVHARFGSNRPGSMMLRIATAHAGVPTGAIDVDAFAALNAAVNRPTHYWTKDQRECRDLIQAIARSCNATPLINFQGLFTVTRAVLSDPVVSIDRTGGVPPRVMAWRQGVTNPPFSQLRARTARPARVLTFDEVNYVDTIIDQGLYNAAESYRAGNIVWLSNGSQWLFVGDAPATGVYPVQGAYWQRLQPPKVAGDFTYSNGATIESLRPAQAGADVTGANTAAAIAGQGALATRNDVAYGTQISGLPAPIQPGNITGGGFLDARQVQYWGGPLVQTLQPAQAGADVTASNTAAAITGQAAWATYNGLVPSNVAGQVQALDTSGNLSSLAKVVDRRINILTRADGTTVITELLVVTAIGTAAAITGQGAGATANTLAQLDPTAAARLESLGEGGPVVVGLNETLKKLVPAGRSVFVEAASVVNAGAVGSPDGTATIRIRWAPAGSLSYTELANGSAPVDAFNEAPVFASGTYTNSGSADLVINFVADVTVAPGDAGGTIRTAESYLRG